YALRHRRRDSVADHLRLGLAWLVPRLDDRRSLRLRGARLCRPVADEGPSPGVRLAHHPLRLGNGAGLSHRPGRNPPRHHSPPNGLKEHLMYPRFLWALPLALLVGARHPTPTVVLVKQTELIRTTLAGAQQFFVRKITIGKDDLTRIRREVDFSPEDPDLSFYLGKTGGKVG